MVVSISPVCCRAFVVAKKLLFLRKQLRAWAKSSFGSIKLKKLALMQEIEEFDILKESRRLSVMELQQEEVTLENFRVILKQEEIYWR